MKITLYTAPNRCRVSTLALALAILLLPGLVRPQMAGAQRTGRRGGVVTGRSAGRGSGLPGGGAGWGGIPPKNPPARIAPPVHPPVGPGPAPRLVAGPSGAQSPQPSSRAVSVYAYPYNYSAPRYVLSGLGWTDYFPNRSVYYPHYALYETRGVTTYSPYYYYATFPPYIGSGYVSYQMPQVNYVPYPVYSSEGLYQGASGVNAVSYTLDPQHDAVSMGQNNGQNGGTNVRDAAELDLALRAAISDLNAAWNHADIHALARHVHRNVSVAVYLKGDYLYSLPEAAYLNMTRDAFSAARTVRFSLDRVQSQGDDIYTVSGRHLYTDKQGQDHTVLVSYVLAKVDGDYFVYQIGTTPAKME